MVELCIFEITGIPFPKMAEGLKIVTRIPTASRQRPEASGQNSTASQLIPQARSRPDDIASHGIKNGDDLVYFCISNAVLFECKYGVNVRSLEIIVCDIEMRVRRTHISSTIFMGSSDTHRKKVENQLIQLFHVNLLKVMPDDRVVKIFLQHISYDLSYFLLAA